jgi:hypothetical protein
MPVPRFQAFISYTSDLKPECDAVAEVCYDMEFVPFDYQKVGANGDSPEEYLRTRALADSDIYLGILGGKFGSMWSPPPDRSAVEGEFDTFRDQGGLRLTAVFHKQLRADEIEVLQAKFRSKTANFKTGVWKRDFDTPEKLGNEVRKAITQFLVRRTLPVLRDQETHRQKWTPVIIWIAIVCAVLVGITALLSLAVPILPREVALFVMGCLTMAIILPLGFVQFQR